MNPPRQQPGLPPGSPPPEAATPPANAAEAPAGGDVRRELPASFGRYRLQKLLGRGGMGAVYLAHDPLLDRLVALKTPRIDGDGPQILARFRREARAAATIRHPNVCPVYDVGECDGVSYLTMAYIEGRPLSEVVCLEPPTPRQAAALVRKLALALHAAHRRGVVHRDLKPANVMIDRAGEPIVMDFGLARRSRGGDPRLTRSGAILGTPAYMPPEQANGDREAGGPAGDVYSLGVILYELLTGRLPFLGEPLQVLFQIVQDDPPRPSSLRQDLDPMLEAICLKAMAKRAEDRYASAAALADALLGWMRQKPAVPTPTKTAGPASRRRSVWPWLLGGALAALSLVVFAAVAPYLAARRAAPSPPAAPTPDDKGHRSGPADPEAVVRPPPQAAPAPAGGPEWFILTEDGAAAADESHPAYQKIRELRKRPGAVVNGLAFSPAGDWIVLHDSSRFATSDPDLPVCKALAELPDAHVLSCVAFTPKGGWVVFGDGGLALTGGDVPKNAQKAISQVRQDHDALRSVAFGPEGYWVLLHGDNDVSCYAPPELAGLLNDLVEKKSVPIRCVAFSPAGDWFVLGGDNACWSNNHDHPAFKKLRELRTDHTLRWIAFAPEPAS